MELTKEEIKVIEKKRTAKRVKALTNLHLMTKEMNKTIESAKKRVQEDIKRCETYLEKKKEFFDKLNEVGDFTFEVVTMDKAEKPYYYYKGERIDLDPIEYQTQRGVIKYVKTGLKTDYKGELVDVEYSIVVEEHRSGSYYYRSNKGYKMNIDGIDRDLHRSDYGKRLTNPKKVVEIIEEDIKHRQSRIDRAKYKASLEERALADLKEKFADAEVEKTTIYSRRGYYDGIRVVFKNGVKVEVTYYEREGVIEYDTRNISYPEEGVDLMNMLQTLKF